MNEMLPVEGPNSMKSQSLLTIAKLTVSQLQYKMLQSYNQSFGNNLQRTEIKQKLT